MEASNLKNMVILKNLPSNLVEEAIIILKANKKIKKLEKVENSKGIGNSKENSKEKDYILKEAEMLVSDYISKLEEKNSKQMPSKKITKNYERLKTYAFVSSLIILIQAIFIII